MSDALDYLNYDSMMDDTQEFLTTDKWDITFDKPAKAVFWPGDLFMKFRVKSVDGLSMSLFDHEPISGIEIRGFEVPVQPGQIKLKNAEVTFQLLDYEDQTIYVLMTDWAFKCCDPLTQKSFRAADLRANMTFTRLNSLNQPVRRYKMKAGIISGCTYTETMDGERAALGTDSSIAIKGMVYPPEFLNLPAV